MSASFINGYKGIYMVTELGEVWRNGRKLSGGMGTNGYIGVSLCVNGKAKRKEIHRIVAETFIPNPEKKKEVNHINGVRTDNRVENLEWVTSSENKRHAIDILGRKPPMTYLGKFGSEHNRSKGFRMTCPKGREEIFESGLEAKRRYGFDNTSISYAAKNFQLPYEFKRGKMRGWTLTHFELAAP